MARGSKAKQQAKKEQQDRIDESKRNTLGAQSANDPGPSSQTQASSSAAPTGSAPQAPPRNATQAQASSSVAAPGPAPTDSSAQTASSTVVPQVTSTAVATTSTAGSQVPANAAAPTSASRSGNPPPAPSIPSATQSFANMSVSGASGQGSSSQGSSSGNTTTRTTISRQCTDQASHRNTFRVHKMPTCIEVTRRAVASETYDQTAFHNNQNQTALLATREQEVKSRIKQESVDEDTARMEHYALRPRKLANGDFNVLTNHFKVNIPTGQVLYEYQVEGLPDTATRAKRKVMILDMIETDQELFASRNKLATDYRRKIISYDPLFGREIAPKTVVKLITINNFIAGSRDAPSPCTLRLEFVTKYDLDGLQSFVQGRDESYQDRGAKEALNIVIAKGVTDAAATGNTFQIGDNRFYFRPGWTDLEPKKHASPESMGLVATRGYYSTIKPGMNGILLNVNNICGAFYKAQGLEQYLETYNSMSDTGKKKLQSHLSGLRIRVNFDRAGIQGQSQALDSNARRHKTLVGFGKVPMLQTFKLDDAHPKQEVWRHLKQKYGTATKEEGKHLPCVNVGGKAEDKQKFYLAHQLDVLADQPFRGTLHPDATDEMIKFAKTRPELNYRAILEEGMRCLHLHAQTPRPQILTNIGIDVSQKLLSIPARAITAPTVRYQGANLSAQKGSWTIPGRASFFDTRYQFGPTQARKHANVQFLRTSDKYGSGDQLLNSFAERFVSHSGNLGCQVLRLRQNHQYLKIHNWDPANLRKLLYEEYVKDPIELVVVVFPQNNAEQRERYNNFKIAADQFLGAKSICLCETKIMGPLMRGKGLSGLTKLPDNYRELAGYLNNVFMKLNVRCGNANHVVNASELPMIGNSNDTIILGADVTHPGAGSLQGTPSIAAVVGTLDNQYARFSGSMRLNPARQEDIAEMRTMVRERLEEWKKVNGTLPSRILFYRDGVGESQYAKVRAHELKAIRKAWQDLNGNENESPRLTAIVVTKRHNTRLYPTPGEAMTGSGNLFPGCVVETGITSPYYFDFFLLSHNVPGGSGTAKPSHYFVLENGMDFSAKELQDLTFRLCFMYCKSTSSVSYVPAAYYADKLCERGRIYLKPFLDDSKALAKKVADGQLDDAGIFTQAERAFYRGRSPAQVGTPANPWNLTLNGTMFWM